MIRDLERKVQRALSFDHTLSITTENILQVQAAFEHSMKEENHRRRDKRKHAMQEDNRAFKWLRRSTRSLYHAVKLHGDDEVAGSPHQALQKFTQHWMAVWRRPKLEVDEVWPLA